MCPHEVFSTQCDVGVPMELSSTKYDVELVSVSMELSLTQCDVELVWVPMRYSQPSVMLVMCVFPWSYPK